MNKRENIYSLTGMSKVLKFTLIQTFKTPAYRASLILFVVIMSLMNPIQTIIANNSMNSAEAAFSTDLTDSGIEAVTVVNKTTEELTLASLTDWIDSFSEGIRVSLAEDAESEMGKLTDSSALVVIEPSAMGYDVKAIVTPDSQVRPSDLSSLAGIVADAFDDTRMSNSSLTQETIMRINSGIAGSEIMSMDDYEAEKNKTVNRDSYFTFVIGYCVLAMVVISLSNSYIISSVTEEKISKLVETLLVSVRPMALLMGKILGMMSYAVSVIVLGFLGSKISEFVMHQIFKGTLDSVSAGAFNFAIFTSFGVKGLIVILVSVLISYLSFALLSGLFGSACVKQEDIQTATGFTMMITMAGYMGAIFGGIPDNNTINLLFSILPPFSYYSLPVMYLCGRISFVVFALSLMLQILIIAGLLLFSARTYRNLILSDASTPKLSAILKSARV